MSPEYVVTPVSESTIFGDRAAVPRQAGVVRGAVGAAL